MTRCGYRSRILRHEAHEALRIAVGDVDARVADRRVVAAAGRRHHAVEPLLVGLGDAHRVERGRLALERREERDEVVHRVVLVQRGRQRERVERARHLHRAGRVHVGGDDRHAVVVDLRVAEAELARDVDVRARGQRAPLGADQHVLEVQPDFVLDAHRGSLPGAGGSGTDPSWRTLRRMILRQRVRRASAPAGDRGSGNGSRSREVRACVGVRPPLRSARGPPPSRAAPPTPRA